MGILNSTEGIVNSLNNKTNNTHRPPSTKFKEGGHVYIKKRENPIEKKRVKFTSLSACIPSCIYFIWSKKKNPFPLFFFSFFFFSGHFGYLLKKKRKLASE